MTATDTNLNSNEKVLRYLDLKKFQEAPISLNPFPYLILQDFIQKDKMMNVCQDFPKITQGGSFPVSEVACDGEFAIFLKCLKSSEFRDRIAEKFSMDLTNRVPMITVRGYTRHPKDGRVHTDSKSKIITVLFYFNPNWSIPEGRLRLLNSNNIDDYCAEVSPEAGTCIIFKVTDNCWHGHLPFEGIRRSIQLNYVETSRTASYELFRHRLSARIKALRKFFS